MKETLTRLRMGRNFFPKERIGARLNINKLKKTLEEILESGDYQTEGRILQLKKFADKYYKYSDEVSELKKEFDAKGFGTNEPASIGEFAPLGEQPVRPVREAVPAPAAEAAAEEEML
jgi:hypothetical protein